jgi:hypothetical protein
MIGLKIQAGEVPVTMTFQDFRGFHLPQGAVPAGDLLDTAFDGCLILSGHGAKISAQALNDSLIVKLSDDDPAPSEYVTGEVVELVLGETSVALGKPRREEAAPAE